MQVRPKKFLGQHFLKDKDVARRIAQSLVFDCGAERMPVLEVGPGTGVLTEFLLQDSRISLSAIELDRESVSYLKQYFPELHLIEGDFLKFNLDLLYPQGKFCVIGNYPYNISSQIFFKVLEYKDRIPCCSGMIQKEVAERLAARPGSKTYGILSVLMQAYYDIEYLLTVSESVFDPPPKVKSAVVRFVRNSTYKLNCDEVLFKQIVKTAFNQRRKQMRNSLQQLVGKGSALLEEPIFKLRPEQLSVEQFVELTNFIDANK